MAQSPPPVRLSGPCRIIHHIFRFGFPGDRFTVIPRIAGLFIIESGLLNKLEIMRTYTEKR